MPKEQMVIHDSYYYVDKMLRYYRDKDHFSKFDNKDLLVYSEFLMIIKDFQKHYGSEKYSVKEIDKMLWQMGKYHFPKYQEK